MSDQRHDCRDSAATTKGNDRSEGKTRRPRPAQGDGRSHRSLRVRRSSLKPSAAPSKPRRPLLRSSSCSQAAQAFVVTHHQPLAPPIASVRSTLSVLYVRVPTGVARVRPGVPRTAGPACRVLAVGRTRKTLTHPNRPLSPRTARAPYCVFTPHRRCTLHTHAP